MMQDLPDMKLPFSTEREEGSHPRVQLIVHWLNYWRAWPSWHREQAFTFHLSFFYTINSWSVPIQLVYYFIQLSQILVGQIHAFP